MIDSERRERIRVAELLLLDPGIRADSVRVTELLHPDFLEVGRSGRRWSRTTIVDALQAASHAPVPQTSEWVFVALSETLTLVSYRLIDHTGAVSRHSSVWEILGDRVVMRFHQGTPLATEEHNSARAEHNA